MVTFEKLLLPLIRSVTPVNPDEIDAASTMYDGAINKCPMCKAMFKDGDVCFFDGCPMDAEIHDAS